MPSFPCPHCNSQIKVADPGLIGQTLPCPGCNTPLVVRCDRPTRRLWGEKIFGDEASLSSLKAVVAELKAAEADSQRQNWRRFAPPIAVLSSIVIFFLWIANWKRDTTPGSPPPSAPQASSNVIIPNEVLDTGQARPSAGTTSERDRQIDAWVDRAVEKNWRPMPDGNSKEDSAKVSKEILRAYPRTFAVRRATMAN